MWCPFDGCLASVVHETIRVKSAAWDDTGVLVYTTLNHIKYCLPNGDSGIIRTLEVPVYITRVSGSSLHCLDRDGKSRQIQVSPATCGSIHELTCSSSVTASKYCSDLQACSGVKSIVCSKMAMCIHVHPDAI